MPYHGDPSNLDTWNDQFADWEEEQRSHDEADESQDAPTDTPLFSFESWCSSDIYDAIEDTE